MSLASIKNGYTNPLAPYQVQKAKMADLKEISEFLLGDFLTSEPLNAALELGRDESEHFFTSLVETSLLDGLSYLVKDPTVHDRLVAVRLACILRRNDDQQENGKMNGDAGGKGDLPFGNGRGGNRKICKICAILHTAESKIWQLVPAEFTTLASWMVISVSNDYKRRGIGAALLEYGLDEPMALGCQGLIAEASAVNSQKLFQKLGYIRIYELLHADWKDPEGGQVFICKDGTDRVTLEFKPLNVANGKAAAI